MRPKHLMHRPLTRRRKAPRATLRNLLNRQLRPLKLRPKQNRQQKLLMPHKNRHQVPRQRIALPRPMLTNRSRFRLAPSRSMKMPSSAPMNCGAKDLRWQWLCADQKVRGPGTMSGLAVMPALLPPVMRLPRSRPTIHLTGSRYVQSQTTAWWIDHLRPFGRTIYRCSNAGRGDAGTCHPAFVLGDASGLTR